MNKQAIALLIAALLPSHLLALDIGFSGEITADMSDNINESNRGSELSGTTVSAGLSVFGSHESSRVLAGFNSDFVSDRQFDSEDSDTEVDTLVRFYGATEIKLTPRVLRWYVGDALGAVSSGNQVQLSSDETSTRRNAFFTGPEVSFQFGAGNKVNSRLLYVHQSDDTDVELAQLLSYVGDFSRELIGGHTLGFRLTNLFTNNPDAQDATDLNRTSGALVWNRKRAEITTNAEIGGTTYQADDDRINGVAAGLTFTRTLSRDSSLSLAVTHDLTDQTLNVLQSLVSQSVATDNDVQGVAEETRATLEYQSLIDGNNISFAVGGTTADFKRLNNNDGFTSIDASLEDYQNVFARASWNRRVTNRLTADLGGAYVREDFVNRPDEADSIAAAVGLSYSLSTSWYFISGYSIEAVSGVETSGLTGEPEEVDRIENRIKVGLRWAPPSRASSDLTTRLKSLLK